VTKKRQMTFEFAGRTRCLRCGATCRIEPVAGSRAKLLKRGKRQGLCINCAVHDTLRHLYPANLILARSGPQGLSLPHIQRQFYEICRLAGTDAEFAEIDWQAIIDHWELPFRRKIKPTATNPVTEEDLSQARLEGAQRRAGTWKEPPTPEECESQRQAAKQEFLQAMRKPFNEDP